LLVEVAVKPGADAAPKAASLPDPAAGCCAGTAPRFRAARGQRVNDIGPARGIPDQRARAFAINDKARLWGMSRRPLRVGSALSIPV